MRSDIYANGEFYHVYNRGVDKRDIFLTDDDYLRFLKTCRVCNSLTPQNKAISKLPDVQPGKRLVNIHAYCLLPNHYHLLLEQLVDNGVSTYMQRVGNAFTKYFNIRHERSGRLFQNVFQIEHVDSNPYFEYLQGYIHLNPCDLPTITCFDDLISYRWSSLTTYLSEHPSFIEKQKISLLYRSTSDLKQHLWQQFQHHRLGKRKGGKLR